MINKVAINVPDAYVPFRDEVYDGVRWIGFAMDHGTFDEYQRFPKVLAYDGKHFVKMSWNSDILTITFREVTKVARPI